MKKLNHDQFQMYLDVESAVAPIDDVIRVLRHAHEDFHLGNLRLDELEKFDLLNRYETLGSILMLVTRQLEEVVEDIEKIGAEARPDPEKAGA